MFLSFLSPVSYTHLDVYKRQAVAGTQKIAAPAVGTKYGVKVGVLTTNDVTTPEATVEYDQDLADAVQEAIDLQVATDVIGVKDFAVVGGAGNVITSAAVSGYTVTTVSYTHLDVYKRQVKLWYTFK